MHLHVGEQVIRTTPEHPFRTRDRGWLSAAELQIGDLLSTKTGEWVRLDDYLDTGEFEEVYNFEVEDFHTYFVGGNEWGFAVWVHNTYGDLLQAGNKHADLLERAYKYRVTNNWGGADASNYGFNVAVVKYRTRAGNIRTKAFRSGIEMDDGSWTSAGGPANHSEQHMIRWLKRNGYTADAVEAVFSERSPCDELSTNCSTALSAFGIASDRVFYGAMRPVSPAGIRDLYL